jgi:hypothetical protein
MPPDSRGAGLTAHPWFERTVFAALALAAARTADLSAEALSTAVLLRVRSWSEAFLTLESLEPLFSDD